MKPTYELELESTELTVAAPAAVETLPQAEEAVKWLRLKRAFDKAVDFACQPAIKAAYVAHKAALQLSKDLKAPSDTLNGELRARIEAYAEKPDSELPGGVYRRKKFVATIVHPKLVPPEFLVPDLKLIEDFAQRTEGAIPIHGVEIREEIAVTIREEKDNG